MFVCLPCRSETKELTEVHVTFIYTYTGKIHKTPHEKIFNLFGEDPQISTAATLDVILKSPFFNRSATYYIEFSKNAANVDLDSRWKYVRLPSGYTISVKRFD